MLRLKTRTQFQAALAGQTLARTTHFALHRCALEPRLLLDGSVVLPRLFAERGVWFGAMVPKRWAKRAVTRNTIKRQIYSVSTEFELSLVEGAHVVRLRTGFDRAQFTSATSEVLRLAVRMELLKLFERALTSSVRQAVQISPPPLVP
ncbi:MAG: ribonuclease P protein component [Rhodoferax sp.]|nr:ribonuclease P protein component [Rhodoferax sp.]MDP3655003.1 ribonuclease P protein component [Rhodoferax sp.]